MISAAELLVQLQSPEPPQLIQVLPPAIHAAAHLPGAQNACVYEVAFLDRGKALVPDLSTPIVVYGAGGTSLDALTAAEKLRASTDGTPNYLLRGTFTLRGITQPLAFPILLAVADDARRLTGQGQFELDRTAYGSHYGSGKLFRYLGPHLVNDHIHLHTKIHADKVEPAPLGQIPPSQPLGGTRSRVSQM